MTGLIHVMPKTHSRLIQILNTIPLELDMPLAVMSIAEACVTDCLNRALRVVCTLRILQCISGVGSGKGSSSRSAGNSIFGVVCIPVILHYW